MPASINRRCPSNSTNHEEAPMSVSGLRLMILIRQNGIASAATQEGDFLSRWCYRGVECSNCQGNWEDALRFACLLEFFSPSRKLSGLVRPDGPNLTRLAGIMKDFQLEKFCAGARVILCWLLFAFTLPVAAQKVPVVEKQLANGMRVLMVVRHDEPTVAGGWVAHVGSSNERPGMTGIAHLFEHMMFKGTPTIGTKDYKKDLEIMAEQERLRDEMRLEERKMRVEYRKGEIDDLLKPENRSERYKELEKRFNELIAQQRAIMVKDEFDRVYSGNGASGMNAFTTEDLTGYFVNVPANKLELWMWMESERLLHPVFREFYAERDVVFEERRMRTESTPLGKFAEEFNALFWESSPYSWPVVGWPSDIPACFKERSDDFYGI